MLYRATRNGQVTVKSSDKKWPTGGGNGKVLQYSCLKNPIDVMKRQKYMTPEDEPPQVERCPTCYWRSRGQLLIAPERMKWLGQSGNDTQLWMHLVVKVKTDAVKSNIT